MGRAALILAMAVGLIAGAGLAQATWHLEAPGFSGDLRPFTLRQTPKPPPSYQAVTPAGPIVLPDDLRGKVVLLNFWATWCPPCVEEMPSLDRLQAERGGAGFQVVALSLDDKLELIQPFYDKFGLTHLAIYWAGPPPAAFDHYRLGVLPTTMLLDAEGRVVGTLGGPAQWDSPEAFTLIDHFLGQAGEPPSGKN